MQIIDINIKNKLRRQQFFSIFYSEKVIGVKYYLIIIRKPLIFNNCFLSKLQTNYFRRFLQNKLFKVSTSKFFKTMLDI